MKNLIKKLLVIGILIVNIFTIIFSNNNLISYATETKSGVINKTELVNKLSDDETFKEFENVLVSKTPKVYEIKQDNKIVGYIAQYEIYTNTKEKIKIDHKNKNYDGKEAHIDINTQSTSVLTFIYRFSDSKIEALLIDYSKLIENTVSLIDLKSCIMETFAIDKNTSLFSKAEELRTLRKSMIEDARKQIASMGYNKDCHWWVCTKYETVGGYMHEKCEKYLGWACKGASVKNKLKLWAWALCKGGSLIACYVPKTKHCVSGYWETRFCPAPPR